MRLEANFSSACAFANGTWAKASGGPRDTPKARLSFQTRQRAGQSEREMLRRVNPRSGGPEQSGSRKRTLKLVRDVETSKTEGVGGHASAMRTRPDTL
jgi:hypothetical protein